MQIQLRIAGVYDEKHVADLHLLSFADRNLHQLSAHLRHNGNVRLSFQFRAEFNGDDNVLLLDSHCLIGRVNLLRNIEVARDQPGHHTERRDPLQSNSFHGVVFMVIT